MRTFTLHLQSATQYERVEGVTSFVAEDASGSFGIRAGHERMMTALAYGLARYALAGDRWEYVAAPGGLLYFVANELWFSTRRYLRSADYLAIGGAIAAQLAAQEQEARSIRENLYRLEQEMLRRLWEMERPRR